MFHIPRQARFSNMKAMLFRLLPITNKMYEDIGAWIFNWLKIISLSLGHTVVVVIIDHCIRPLSIVMITNSSTLPIAE